RCPPCRRDSAPGAARRPGAGGAARLPPRICLCRRHRQAVGSRSRRRNRAHGGHGGPAWALVVLTADLLDNATTSRSGRTYEPTIKTNNPAPKPKTEDSAEKTKQKQQNARYSTLISENHCSSPTMRFAPLRPKTSHPSLFSRVKHARLARLL